MFNNKYDNETILKIVKLYADGMSVEEICNQSDIPLKYISKWIKRYEKIRNKEIKRREKQLEEELPNLQSEFNTLKQEADELTAKLQTLYDQQKAQK